MLKRAEIIRETSLCEPLSPLAPVGQCTVEEELRACIPCQTIPLNVKVCLDVERFYQVWIVQVGCKSNKISHHYNDDIIYDIINDILCSKII